MRVVVAPSAFKGTLAPWEAAEAIAEGVKRARPDAQVVLCPLADGGSGTAEILRRAIGGQVRTREVNDPLGSLLTTSFVELADGRGVVEVASAASMALCDGKVMAASSIGVGDLIRYAARLAPDSIVVACGDSGTSEGGLGALVGLGYRFLDPSGVAIATTPGGLQTLHSIEGEVDLPPIVAACDVRNPLIGPQGAAATFGPQKGATGEGVKIIEAGLSRFADIIEATTGRHIHDMPRAGAAGGLAGGLHGVLGAELKDGFDIVAEAIDLPSKLRGADLLIVGEGSLDAQSLQGKASIRAAKMTKIRGIKAVAMCGIVRLDMQEMSKVGITGAFDLSGIRGVRGDPAKSLSDLAHRTMNRFY